MKTIHQNLLYVFLILLSSYIMPVYSAQSNIKQADRFYKEGNIAQAAIYYSALKYVSKLSPKDRADAIRRFNTCIQLLQSDTTQTDLFGTLISSQKNNQQVLLLLQKYSYLLESQRRYKKLIAVQKQIYSLSPTTSQKYNLARKLEIAGAYNEAYELYHDLLTDRKYNRIALRQLLDILKYTHNSKTKLDRLLKKYYKRILESYDLSVALLNTFIDFRRAKDAVNISMTIVSRYPQSADMVIGKIISLYNNGNLSDSLMEEIATIATQHKNKLSDEQRYLLAKIFVGSNNLKQALDLIGDTQSQKMMEYKADLFISAEQLSHAKDLYVSLLKKYPPQQNWYRKIAEISFRIGDDQEGIEYIDKYLQNTSNFNDYFYAGRLLERYGFLNQAEKIYLEGKKHGANRSLAIKQLTKYYLSRKNFDLAAKEIYNSQINSAINPKNLYVSIKRTFANQYEEEQLIKALRKLVEKKKPQEISTQQTANLYYCLHIFADQISDIDQSTDFFIKYIQNTPDKEKKILSFAKRLEKNGFADKSYKLLSYIPQQSPLYPQTVKQRVLNLINRNKSDEALKILRKNPKIKDDYLMALAMYKNGQTKEALDIISAIKRLSPATYLLRADIALSNKNFDTALTFYTKISNRSPLYTKSLFQSGLTNLFMNKFDKALSFFEKVAEQNRSDEETVQALWYRTVMAIMKNSPEEIKKWATAEYLSQTDKPTFAIDLYSKIIETNPKEPYIPYLRLRLSKLMIAQNQPDQAVLQLEKISIDFPKSALAPESMSMIAKIKNGTDQEYIKLLEKYPDSYDADRVRALISQKNKKYVDQL